MSDGLLCRLFSVWQPGRCAALGERGTDMALAVHETLPDSIGRRDAEIRVQCAKGFSFVSKNNHELEECPQRICAEAQAFDFIGDPNAESVSATAVALLAVVTEDAPAATRFPIFIGLSVAIQLAVENQRSSRFAMRTGRESQALILAKKVFIRTVESRKRKTQKIPR